MVIAGNYGRAKTAQLYMLYAHYANQISRADGTLPFFARMSEIEPTDDAPDQIIARAISNTYKRCGIELPVPLLVPRLQQPFLLCLDGDQEADSRQREAAFDALKQITETLPQAAAVVTLDEQVIGQLPALRATDPETDIPILLVQLLSPTTVAQYLNGFGDRFQPLLTSIQAANLFDLAGVPWLLANLIRQSNRGGALAVRCHRARRQRQPGGGEPAGRHPAAGRRNCSAASRGSCRPGRRSTSTRRACTRSSIRSAGGARCRSIS